MPTALILDCGATNVRAIVVDEQGEVISSQYKSNKTLRSGTKHIWSFQQVWQKLVDCCQKVTSLVNSHDISAVAVTTFGVDGAPFDRHGKQIYPIVSWKCSRTESVMSQVIKEFDRRNLYLQNGVGDYPFNTLFKIKWLKDNEPEVYRMMNRWVFISSMINFRLTGVLTTDRTMAGTSMMTNLMTGDWNKDVLEYLELTPEHFPPMVDAGEYIGVIKDDIASLCNLPQNTPVISAGHDTQLALFGSGAKKNQIFLSSGTWEILTARASRVSLKFQDLDKGVTTELDTRKGLYNPAIQWLSGAVMDWVTKTFFNDLANHKDKHLAIAGEGAIAPMGCNGVVFDPVFFSRPSGGVIQGFSVNTTRGEIYRAALEGLAFKLASSLEDLSEVCDLESNSLMVVGGGSRNILWNQIRADVLGIPMEVVDQPEATVTGAAMFALSGVGVFKDAEQAQETMKPGYGIVEPSANSENYQRLIEERKNA